MLMPTNQLFSCLIIEDEPLAAEVIRDYISEVTFLDLKGICTDALDALDLLQRTPVDVLFLDIHLPKLKGLPFLKTLSYQPQVILTTAYHQYTLDAFEIGVVDYLVKPIEFMRFLKAVNKLQFKQEQGFKAPTLEPLPQRPFRFFNVNKKMVRIFFDEILYVESLKEYCRIFTAQENWVTRGQIGEMEAIFQAHRFMRIHRSYLVAIDKIKAYSTSKITVENKDLPIGRSYKRKVLEVMSS
ncbi:MAG: LytTR family DNA-binding domain-containing protein [Saprospiraceae bacterium]